MPRRHTHIHTHAYTTSPSHRFFLPSARNLKVAIVGTQVGISSLYSCSNLFNLFSFDHKEENMKKQITFHAKHGIHFIEKVVGEKYKSGIKCIFYAKLILRVNQKTFNGSKGYTSSFV